jgi:hypothetical protein
MPKLSEASSGDEKNADIMQLFASKSEGDPELDEENENTRPNSQGVQQAQGL